MSDADGNLRLRTASTAKWNVVDKVATQLLYAVTGIILANLVSPKEFGLLGAVLVFQSFATLFIDGGFAMALIQRKEPTERDYSTVFWFNMASALAVYAVLWVCAPAIDGWFHGEGRLVWLARASFLTFVLNAAGIVQTNRMVKRMTFRPVALANCLGLLGGGIVGVVLALRRPDAWALVWQQVATAGLKSLLLWIFVRWRPLAVMSFSILKGFFRVGGSVALQTFLYLVFQNIYGLFIGRRLGFVPLGVYNQADKWSRMGPSALSAILTSSFLPALSAVQDDPERFARISRRIHRVVGLLLFAGFGWLIVVGAPIFHALFGDKWDAAIPLFQLLTLRAVFTVLCSLYCNFMVAVGRARRLVVNEIVRDGAALIALVATLPLWGRPDGLEIMVWGQVVASAVTFAVTVVMTARVTWRPVRAYLGDLLPSLLAALLPLLAALWLASLPLNPWLQLLLAALPLLPLFPYLRRLLK